MAGFGRWEYTELYGMHRTTGMAFCSRVEVSYILAVKAA